MNHFFSYRINIKINKDEILVRYGNHLIEKKDDDDEDDDVEEYRAVDMRIHPKYKVSTADYDLAIIMVDRLIDAIPIPLSKASRKELVGKKGVVCGFGKTSVIPRYLNKQ